MASSGLIALSPAAAGVAARAAVAAGAALEAWAVVAAEAAVASASEMVENGFSGIASLTGRPAAVATVEGHALSQMIADLSTVSGRPMGHLAHESGGSVRGPARRLAVTF